MLADAFRSVFRENHLKLFPIDIIEQLAPEIGGFRSYEASNYMDKPKLLFCVSSCLRS